ncbi:C4-dicarboxylate ABC transporter permease [candidate division Kazan bacterium]|uniref:C4-dicarboxylate ABC transporter permease n=1 Tax=candidate division Kazan bacterium TaxID=2202143 RepID=A0A420ZBU2_UNCK3|nr:MAG: C4-dicarboxylate ABC transporter permease [candidate division Kazan bacterium]
MDPLTIGYLGCILAVILMFLGMPVAYAFGLIGFVGTSLINGWQSGFASVGLYPFRICSISAYSVIPLFIFMGYVILFSGVGSEFFVLARKWIGHVRGGLAMTTVLSSAGFGAVSGDVVSAAVTMAAISLPETRKHKYADRLIIGSIAGGANLSFIIPPSLGFILFGAITSTSIGQLFIAGIIPGIMITLLFLALISFLCKRHPEWGAGLERASWKERLIAFKSGWVVITTFILVIGGIYFGVFTPTEAAAAGSAFVLIISLLRKNLDWEGLKKALVETGLTTGMIMLILFCCMIFSLFLALSGVAGVLESFLLSLKVSRYIILAITLIVYVFIGLFMDVLAMILVTLPFIFPIIVNGLGFDPIFFGVVVILAMIMGHISPPFGIVIYSLKATPICNDIPLFQLFRAALPFLGVMTLSIFIIILFPELATYLPAIMMK